MTIQIADPIVATLGTLKSELFLTFRARVSCSTGAKPRFGRCYSLSGQNPIVLEARRITPRF